jgi:hypothetical protein
MKPNISLVLVGGVVVAMAATAYAALPKSAEIIHEDALVNAAGVAAVVNTATAGEFAALSAMDFQATQDTNGGTSGSGGGASTPAASPMTADQLAQAIEAAVNALPAGSTAAQIQAAVNGVLDTSGVGADVQTAALSEASGFFAANSSVSQALSGVSPIPLSQQQASSQQQGGQQQGGYSPFSNPQSTGAPGGFGATTLTSITVAPVISTSNGTVAEGQPVIS